ncbi:hypothetical protein AD998_01220 [bacterium 336/3]|nr:hypothetical protein AD998_01220 [bacterium 336/3]
MKKLQFPFLLLLTVLFMGSCISSEYLITDKTAFVDDDQLVGSWKFVPPAKKSAEELELPIDKIIFTKSSSTGTYTLDIKNKPTEGEQPKEDKPLDAYISILKGTKIVNFGAEEEGKKGYCYFKYKVKDGKLSVSLFFEKGVNEAKAKGKRYDASNAKPTKFASEKIFRDFIAKNLNNKLYWSEELVFTKE